MEDTPGEIAKIKENLIVCIAEIKSLRDDLIKLKTEANLEHGNDTLPKRQLFVKGPDVTEDNEINRWGVYQAIRWLQWKKNLLKTPKFKNGRDKPLSDRKNGSA
ncbi:coiled-coil domain-containing protein 154-like [Heptranchias perlo]|uniref:coiled-coil domain-containing protein 154-like n=1 Tax=Heptranchias perlo TaxID=212740 RepID=UPI003559FF48